MLPPPLLLLPCSPAAAVQVANNFGPPEAWKGLVPGNGTLSFDYVSGVLAPEDAQPVADALLNEVLTQDVSAACRPAARRMRLHIQMDGFHRSPRGCVCRVGGLAAAWKLMEPPMQHVDPCNGPTLKGREAAGRSTHAC